MESEYFEKNGISLCVSREHRINTDSLLLGEFAAQSVLRGKRVCDLCSGCGIIPVMLYGCSGAARLYAVELQESAAALLRRTIVENLLDEDVLRLVRGDLRDRDVLAEIGRESVDVVTMNPPYYPKRSGFERESAAEAAARHDGDCALGDAVAAADYLLKFGGELKLCMTAARLAETTGAMQARGIEPKRIVVVPGKGGVARLVLVSGKKGAKPGVRVEIAAQGLRPCRGIFEKVSATEALCRPPKNFKTDWKSGLKVFGDS